MAAARPPLGGLVVYECRYRLGRLALHAREYLAVGIEGDRNRRVAEPLAHDLRMNARAECVCRVRMSQIVEADPRKPGAADKALKAVAELTGVDWISTLENSRLAGSKSSRSSDDPRWVARSWQVLVSSAISLRLRFVFGVAI